MLLVAIRDARSRLAETFKERFVEWGLAGSMLMWGAIVSRTEGLFERPFYSAFVSIAPQWVWGTASIAVALMSFVALAINGAWQRTPMLRMIGCGLRIVVWSGLCIGSISTEIANPAIAYLGLLFLLDTVCLLLAARDHGLVLISRGAAPGNVE